MNAWTSVLTYAVPFVIACALVEAIVLSRLHRGDPYDWYAAALSLVDFLVREFVLRWILPLTFWGTVLAWMYAHRWWTMPMNHWSGWVAVFVGQEFAYYVYHRAAHRVRWFWCTHAVHHSATQLNLSAAFRFGWTGKLTGTLAFFVLLPLVGMPPRVVLLLLSLNLLYQFWLHAAWIPPLGPLEWVFNTPSAHRVHHSSRIIDLDCNYGGVLIVFDRLFGTYRREVTERTGEYGLVGRAPPRNLFRLEFDQWLALWADVKASRTFGQAWGHVRRPPGWRPDGSGTTTEDLRRRVLFSH